MVQRSAVTESRAFFLTFRARQKGIYVSEAKSKKDRIYPSGRTFAD